MGLVLKSLFMRQRPAIARIVCRITRQASVFGGMVAVLVMIPSAAGHAGQRLYDMRDIIDQPHPFEAAPNARTSAPAAPIYRPTASTTGSSQYGREAPANDFETLVQRRDALGSPKSFGDPEIAAAPPNVRLSISGHVNRALLFIDDGSDDGTDEDKNFFNVDSDNSATRLRFLAYGRIDENRSIGSNIVLQFQSNSTSSISQSDTSSTEDFVGTRNLEVWFSHAKYGEIWMGKGHTASDDTTERDLSRTGVAAYSGVADMAAGIEFRVPEGRLSGISMDDVFNNLDGLGRDNRLRYDTPRFRGANIAVSLVDGGNWDGALIYSQKLPKRHLALVAAVHYANAQSTRDFDQIGGSVSVLNETNGLNVTAALGIRDQVAGDRKFAYVKIGWQAKFFRVGKSNMSLDFFGTRDAVDFEDDEGLSAGLFIVQHFREVGSELYGGVRWYSYEDSTTNYQDVVAVTIGVRQRF